jgi:OPA family sugar phosphate sensor protein UhpC-like MFS transporter
MSLSSSWNRTRAVRNPKWRDYNRMDGDDNCQVLKHRIVDSNLDKYNSRYLEITDKVNALDNGGAVANRTRMRIFIMSYVTYATYYLARLNLSVALPAIALDLGYHKLVLGLIGSAFSTVYALGLFMNGPLAERFGAKRLITLGLMLSAIVNFLFGFAELSVAMILLWAVNGYAQSTGWPSVVKIISEWFGESRGKVGGLFGTCFLAGSMAALVLSGYIQSAFGWRAAFILPSMILIAFIIPFNVGMKEKNEDHRIEEGNRTLVSGPQSILSKQILTISASYILLQFVRSGLSLWAPTYVFEVFRAPMAYASYGAAIIPLGGIIGSVLSGWISDKLSGSRRIPIMVAMTAGLTLILLMLQGIAALGLTVGVAFLFLSGFTLYGPHVMMTTTIPMDNADAYGAAKVAGLIDGLGYVGLIFADPFIGWIVDHNGWSGATTFWTLSAFIATLLLLTLLKGEGVGKATARPHDRRE